MVQRFYNVKNVVSPKSAQSSVSNRSFYQYEQSIHSKRDFKKDSLNASLTNSQYKPDKSIMEQSRTFKSPPSSFLSDSHIILGTKGYNFLSQKRLNQISKVFLNQYGVAQMITNNSLKQIQSKAYENSRNNFQPTLDSINGLHKVYDQNRDNKITQEDILSLCRRYLNFQKKPIVYTPIVQERLAVARRLFKQFDLEKKEFLTEKQVPNLLNETYKTLGKTFKATKQDIKSWMKLTDNDNDGLVRLPEYQRSIIRALKKQGIKIYEQSQ